MSTFTNLTIIILNHRNDQRLERSLQSAQFADDIMIVDNNSGVDWDSLNQHYRFRVIPYPDVLVDWSVVRNQALAHAHHEWVFFLDSDEVIHPHSVFAITQLTTSPTYNGGLIQRTDVFHGKKLNYGEAGNLPLVRMGKKEHMRFERPVHEEATIKGEVAPTEITITHHSHLSISDFFQKINTYSKREAEHRQSKHEHLAIPALVIFPLAKFVFNYIFKLGFLDGWAGFTYAYMMSLHSFFVRVYQYEQQLPNDQTV